MCEQKYSKKTIENKCGPMSGKEGAEVSCKSLT